MVPEQNKHVAMDNAPAPRSQLFMVRVWLEDLGDGNTEWRGRVQCVANGEVFYFRDWQNMAQVFQTWLSSSNPNASNLKL